MVGYVSYHPSSRQIRPFERRSPPEPVEGILDYKLYRDVDSERIQEERAKKAEIEEKSYADRLASDMVGVQPFSFLLGLGTEDPDAGLSGILAPADVVPATSVLKKAAAASASIAAAFAWWNKMRKQTVPPNMLMMNLFSGTGSDWAMRHWVQPGYVKGQPIPRLGEIGGPEGVGGTAFGWGLYFAQLRDVAEAYRKSAAENRVIPNSLLARYFAPGNVVPGWGGPDEVIKFFPPGTDPDRPYTWSVMVSKIREDGTREPPRIHATMPDAKQIRKVLKEELGAVYKFDLPDADELKFLDWNLKLEDQRESVRMGLASLKKDYMEASDLAVGGNIYDTMLDLDFSGHKTGAEIYDSINSLMRKQMFEHGEGDGYMHPFLVKVIEDTRKAEKYRPDLEDLADAEGNLPRLRDDNFLFDMGNIISTRWRLQHTPELGQLAKELTSRYLATKGIPGLKYLDQGSRIQDILNKTKNYVIWDQSVLNKMPVLEKM